MLNIFGRQDQIASQVETYLPAQAKYSAIKWQFQQGEELGIEELPSILVFSKNSVPADGAEEQYQDMSHTQQLTLVFRIFLPKPYTVSLGVMADYLYNDVVTTLTNSLPYVNQICNPSLTYMFAETTQVQTADLEVPIQYYTSA